jgi:hypothetical protein
MDLKSAAIKHLRSAKEKTVAYARALRIAYREKTPYSRIVFILKVALPSAVALCVGILLLAPEFDEIRKIKIDIPKLESADKISFTMDNGTFYGQGNDGMVFSLSVENFEENRVDNVMTFTKIEGKVYLKDASWLDIKTGEGNYMRLDKLVKLTGNVRLTDDQNNRVDTEAAVIDLENSEVRGDTPIRADTQFGKIRGEGFAFKRNEKYIFTGKVHAIIDSSKLK